MSEFDLELIEAWIESATFWMNMCYCLPGDRTCLDCFSEAMDALRKFWPEHK
jgi:hypothetical protein